MLPDHDYRPLERAIASGLQPFVSELRLTDLVVFIDQIVNGRSAGVAEIVREAAELHFAPGFITYADDATANVDWDNRPHVALGLCLHADPFDCRLRIVLRPDHALIVLQHVASNDPASGETIDQAALAGIVARNSLLHGRTLMRLECDAPSLIGPDTSPATGSA